MDFSNSTFWHSLIPALILLLAVNFCLRKHDKVRRLFQKILMMSTSLILLGLANLTTLLIFLAVTNVAYVACLGGGHLRKRSARKLLLGLLIILLLLPLLYYKYGYFITSQVFPGEWDTLRDLIIPIGISFYTFQIVGFCIDSLMRDEPMPNWLDFMNFGSYFPAIVAGPIERRADLLPQMQQLDLRYDGDKLSEGIRYIILGLFFKMVMADNLALAFLQDYTYGNAWIIWLNNLIFTFRIYFDFAGYGLTAYGLGLCMGIRLRMNFLSPYTACNISEFWRRWHTSLTLWFRDYVYFPLGGSRTKRWALNLVIVFLISGLWHGAGWNFVMWGGFAGVFMICHRLFSKAGGKLWPPLGWFLTFGLMVFVWMFFYDTNPALLKRHLEVIFTPSAYKVDEAIALFSSKWGSKLSVYMPVFIPLAFIIIVMEWLALRRTPDKPYALLIHPITCGVLTYLLIVLHTGVVNQFIYFAF